MQLHPTGTFLLNFVELLNIQVSAQSFPCPLLWAPVTRMPYSHSTYNTYHSLTIQRAGDRGCCSSLHAQGLAEGVWRGWKSEGSWELGLSLGWGVETGSGRVNPVPLIAAGLAGLGLLLYLLFYCDRSCCADSCVPAASKSWEHGLPRGPGRLGASGLQN